MNVVSSKPQVFDKVKLMRMKIVLNEFMNLFDFVRGEETKCGVLEIPNKEVFFSELGTD